MTAPTKIKKNNKRSMNYYGENRVAIGIYLAHNKHNSENQTMVT